MCCKVLLHLYYVFVLDLFFLLSYDEYMSDPNDIKKTEKTQKTVNIDPSTYNAIVQNKGDWQISVFIDAAVQYYIKCMNDDSELSKINTQITEIRDAVRTNLGLCCEVLKQCGVLNGNGEVTFPKSKG